MKIELSIKEIVTIHQALLDLCYEMGQIVKQYENENSPELENYKNEFLQAEKLLQDFNCYNPYAEETPEENIFL